MYFWSDQVVKIGYGKDEKNPIDRFRFYTKTDPKKGIKIKQEEVTFLNDLTLTLFYWS